MFFYIDVHALATAATLYLPADRWCPGSVVGVSVVVGAAVDVGGVDAVVDGSWILGTSAGAADDIIFRSVSSSSRFDLRYFLM